MKRLATLLLLASLAACSRTESIYYDKNGCLVSDKHSDTLWGLIYDNNITVLRDGNLNPICDTKGQYDANSVHRTAPIGQNVSG